ncbi:MAG: hypothetical protein DRP87_03660 [Spirochaetes bacterium]|nr:MAG: hypothetical protein DRP87_03660 [Spirochaetota bacterium]
MLKLTWASEAVSIQKNRKETKLKENTLLNCIFITILIYILTLINSEQKRARGGILPGAKSVFVFNLCFFAFPFGHIFLLRKKALYLWRWSLSFLAGGHSAGYACRLSFGANNHLSSFRLSGNYLALTGLAKP